MNIPSNRKIVVLGGYGAFGSLISGQLTKFADVVIAGRNQVTGQKFADSIGADFSLCDAKDEKSLRSAIAGAHIVINTAGPFLPNDYSIPGTCIEENCHYIDMADGREYVTGFIKLDAQAKDRSILACTGASTTPAVTSAMIFDLSSNFQEIDSIKIYLSAGNKNRPGVSTFESILSYVGTPIRVWNNRRWEEFMGWGSTEHFEFPAPVGRRMVQLCDVPDLELFPKLFGASRVIFKAGVELPIFNIGFLCLAQLKKFIPQLNLPSLAKPLVEISALFRKFGSYAGGILIKVTDKSGQSKTISFVTSQNGPYLPISPAVLLARKLLNENPPAPGAYSCIGFISLQEFRNYLEPFGIKVAAP
jgi:saccharopine dehydrogenase-like NADP-dependent oxidoreductase